MIVLGKTWQEKIIDFVLEARPTGLTHDRTGMAISLMLWRSFRRDVLELYNISFTEYFARVKWYRKIFGD